MGTHLVSVVTHGCLSWAPAASQCLRPSQAHQQRATGAATGAETGTGTGSLTGFGFSFPDPELLSPRKLLGHQYLPEGKDSRLLE